MRVTYVGEPLAGSRTSTSVNPPHSNSPEPLGIFVPDVVGISVLPPGERGQVHWGRGPTIPLQNADVWLYYD